MTMQVCPFHGDEGIRGTRVQDEIGTEVFECQRDGHPHAGSWVWSHVPEPAGVGGPSGLAAELGLHVELPRAIASYGGQWVEYGLVERAYALEHPADFRRLVEQYGHSHLKPTRYTASAYVARVLGELSRRGTVLFRVGRGTGRWSYNSDISYWAVHPAQDWDDRLTWDAASVDMAYVDEVRTTGR